MGLVAFQGVDNHEQTPVSKTQTSLIRSHLKIPENLYTAVIEKYPLLIILIMGSILRIISFTRIPIWYDGALYSDIGWGILKHGTFVTGTQNDPTWGFSLTYPLYLSFFYRFFGFSVFSTHLASLIAGVLAIIVAYLTTTDIFDKRKGLITAAIIAFAPWMIFATGSNITENFLLIFISLTLWALIKSFKNSKYLVPGGVFAVLTLYTKTNIGLSLVIIALIFFVMWQFLYQKKRVLKDPYIIIFVIIVLVGAVTRNLMIATQEYQVSEARSATPHLFTSEGLVQLAFELPFHLLLPATFFLFFIPETYTALSRWKSRPNNLLIFVLLGGLGLILLHAVARQTWLQTLPAASERYFITFYIPTIWLFLGYLTLENRTLDVANDKKTKKSKIITVIERFLFEKKKICFITTFLIGGFIFILVDLWWGVTLAIGAFSFFILKNAQARVTIFIIAFVIAGIGSTLDHQYTTQLTDAMDDMHNYVEDGDTISVDTIGSGLTVSSVSLYLSDIDAEITEYDVQNSTPKYIISQGGGAYENYTLFKIYNDTSPLYLRAQIYTELKRTFLDKDFVWPRYAPIEVWLRD